MVEDVVWMAKKKWNGGFEIIGVRVAKRTEKQVRLVDSHPALGFKRLLSPGEGHASPGEAWRGLLRSMLEDAQAAEGKAIRLRAEYDDARQAPEPDGRMLGA